MFTVVLIKMASDLGFYYTFAGYFALLAHAHAGVLLTALAIQSFAFALSYLLREREGLRFAPFALIALCILLPQASWADYITMLPPTVYAVFMAYKKTYEPEWDREADIFSVFWKLFLGLVFFGVVFRTAKIIGAIVIPMGVVTFTGCVLLTRSLRHEPEVYCSPRYQVMNLATVLLVSLAAGLLGSHAFLAAMLAVLKVIYSYIITPVMYVVIYALIGAIRVLMFLFSWIKLKKPEQEQETKLDLRGAKELMGLEEFEQNDTVVGKNLIIGVTIIAVAVILFFLFRFLARRKGDEKPSAGITDTRYRIDAAGEQAAEREEGTNVQKVRALYRRFLKLCAKRGIARLKSDTSLDVARRYSVDFDGADADALRGIYIGARYNGEASKDDAARAKELYHSLKAQKTV